MADGFDVTMEYTDGQGMVLLDGDEEDPNMIRKIPVDRPHKAVMKADHIGLKPSMEESSKLHHIFESTRAVWEAGIPAALSDGFWYYVYNNALLPRAELEKYHRFQESNDLLRNLHETHKEELDELYRKQKWGFPNLKPTCWYVFWDDVHACNSDTKHLSPEDFDPIEPTAICNQETMARQRPRGVVATAEFARAAPIVTRRPA
ncbi:unnamed protein product [Phytophthora fragariaefolia]|uniref:Unnamed protein product n=1 Tax=Phytophthora fragariaefolia TaxID=1490495 RepID=A0A9W7D1B6_9STRA|nr:unnamed protein product [Phytophthora fragariaefolia]